MQYTIPGRLNVAKNITRAAEQQIKKETGMCIRLMIGAEIDGTYSPERMLEVIAHALEVDTTSYTQKSRLREIVELRFIASRLLRQYFPTLTLQQISMYYGGQDHTSVINGLARAAMLLDCKDEEFTRKYNTAHQHVKIWIRSNANHPAPAISA